MATVKPLLNHVNYRCDEAATLEAAQQLLAGQRYAAMIINLEDMDQSSLAALYATQSKTQQQHLPVILFTASMVNDQLSVETKFQTIEWLEKPIDANKLLDLIHRFCNETRQTKPCILHVEDDSDLRTVISTLGSDLAEFTGASTLSQARALLTQNPYDLVILDIGLPDGSGWDLLPQINQLPNPPLVLVLSGQVFGAEQQRQVDYVLIKSKTSNESLLSTLRQAITRNARPTGKSTP